MQALQAIRFSIPAALALALAACGGGGGSATDATQSTDPAPSTGSTSTVSTDAIDKYLGTFVSTACVAMTDVVSATTKAPLYEKRTFVGETKLAANRAQVKFIHAFFETSSCADAVATLTVSGESNTLTVDGTVDVSQGTADKVTVAEGNKLPGISAGTITIGAASYLNGYTLPKTSKTLMLLTGSDLFTGSATAALDTQGYPTALNASASYKKQ